MMNSLEHLQGTSMGGKIQTAAQGDKTPDWLSNVCLIVQTGVILYQNAC